jgi:uncharacterized paraquat-inducible protein A
MDGLPWWTWLSVGLLVAVMSSVVGGKLELFVWVGVLFILIGIAKLVIAYVFRQKEAKQEHTQHQYQTPQQTHQAFYCPRCRSTVRTHDFFCSRCGTRLR